MSRWEPNARERLERAALELFGERGYDSTTVTEIAERAGLTKRTFFRHFADKREVLFGGQELLTQWFTEAITATPGTPMDALAAALAAVSPAFPRERHALVRQRQAVIAENDNLRERELLKSATLTAAMADAFRGRGVPDPTASLAAQLGMLAFRTAFARWVEAPGEREFADLAREALAELGTATAALAQPAR